MGKWFFALFSLELRKSFAYRFDFWMQFAANVVVQLVLAYALWSAIFSSTGASTMGGYSFSTLMLYYLLVPLVDRMVRGGEPSHIAQDIYEGNLNRYLVYPVSFFVYHYTTHVSRSLITFLQSLLALMFYLTIFGLPEEIHPHWWDLVLGLIAISSGSLLHYMMISVVEMAAFWADHIWSLLVMLRFITFFAGGAMLPLSFFPEKMQVILKFLPFPYLIQFPVDVLQGRILLQPFLTGFAIATLWTFVFFFLLWSIWRAGLKKYTGVGM